MIHADDNFMLVYACLWLKSDGSCHPRYIYVGVLGRTLHIPDKPIGTIKGVAQKECFRTDDFEVVQHTGMIYDDSGVYVRYVVVVVIIIIIIIIVVVVVDVPYLVFHGVRIAIYVYIVVIIQ